MGQLATPGFDGVLRNPNGLVIIVNNGVPSARDFSISGRQDVAAFPVVIFRPTTNNTVMAFDTMPNGTPAEIPGEGFCWFDICDVDFRQFPAAPGHSARVGITSIAVQLGSRTFNGAADLPVQIIAGNAGAIAQFDPDAALLAGDTSMQIFDMNSFALQRVTVGAPNSGGAGFRLLRIPN